MCNKQKKKKKRFCRYEIQKKESAVFLYLLFHTSFLLCSDVCCSLLTTVEVGCVRRDVVE